MTGATLIKLGDGLTAFGIFVGGGLVWLCLAGLLHVFATAPVARPALVPPAGAGLLFPDSGRRGKIQRSQLARIGASPCPSLPPPLTAFRM
jgi:hypothetical protein